MAIKHFKASEYAPESPSAIKVVPFLTLTTIDRELKSENNLNDILPGAFILEKGVPITGKAPSSCALYVIEGELELEDVSIPGKLIPLTAGDVTVMDEGTLVKMSTKSRAKGFGVGYASGGSILTDFIFP